MAYIRVRTRNSKRNKSKNREKSCANSGQSQSQGLTRAATAEPFDDLFSFADNPADSESADIRSLYAGMPLIPKFYENEPNLINSSPELMTEYKRQQQWLEAMRIHNKNKRQKTTNTSNYGNYYYFEPNLEPYNTVLVRVLSSIKPTKQEICDNLEKLGKIEDIVIHSIGSNFLCAFVRFESTEVAFNLCHSSPNVVFKYRIVSEAQIQCFSKPRICAANEGIEELADMRPIEGQSLITRVRATQPNGRHFEELENELLLTETDRNKRQKLIHRLECILNELGFHCILHIFGSTVNRIGFHDSDIDIFIELIEENNFNVNMSSELASTLLDRIRTELRRRLRMYIRPQIRSRRCPLLRLDFRHFADSLRSNGITIDLSLVNGLGIRNSKLIAFYCQLEPRFQTLATVLRYLAKINGFIGSSLMSSYAFSMLVIFFCQVMKPPLLPTVQQLMELSLESVVINGIESGFCDNLMYYHNCVEPTEPNQMSINELFSMFFQFYANFDFKTRVICPLFGKCIPKANYDSFLSRQHLPPMAVQQFILTDKICIQDPFDICFNMSHHMPYQHFCRLTAYFQKVAADCHQYFKDITPEENGSGGLEGSGVEEDENKEKEITFADLLDTQTITLVDLEEEYFETEDLDNEIEIVDRYLSQHLIGKVSVDFDSNHSSVAVEGKLNEMALNVMIFFKDLFKTGYRINTYLIKFFGVKVNQKSVFVKFVIKFKTIHKTLIDVWNRESALTRNKDKVKGLNRVDREQLITQTIVEDKDNSFTKYETLKDYRIDLELSLETNYEIYLNISNVEPNDSIESNALIEFIVQTIRSGLASEQLLAIDDDIFIL